MLSYQHGYHAGNRADVLKHAVLHALLTELAATHENILYVETHSGRGRYDLTGAQAAKKREADDGILSMTKRRGPRPLQPWVDFVEAQGIRNYPGSPAHAQLLLPKQTRFVLFEKHPAEYEELTKAIGKDDRFQIRKADGYSGALKLSPRRGEQLVCLIDPSYETDRDIEDLAEWVPRALKRWPGATLIIWLPLFLDGREEELVEYLINLTDGLIVGARWPVDPLKETALEGSAIVTYGAPESAYDRCSAIAAALQSWWSDKPLTSG